MPLHYLFTEFTAIGLVVSSKPANSSERDAGRKVSIRVSLGASEGKVIIEV